MSYVSLFSKFTFAQKGTRVDRVGFTCRYHLAFQRDGCCDFRHLGTSTYEGFHGELSLTSEHDDGGVLF